MRIKIPNNPISFSYGAHPRPVRIPGGLLPGNRILPSRQDRNHRGRIQVVERASRRSHRQEREVDADEPC